MNLFITFVKKFSNYANYYRNTLKPFILKFNLGLCFSVLLFVCFFDGFNSYLWLDVSHQFNYLNFLGITKIQLFGLFLSLAIGSCLVLSYFFNGVFTLTLVYLYGKSISFIVSYLKGKYILGSIGSLCTIRKTLCENDILDIIKSYIDSKKIDIDVFIVYSDISDKLNNFMTEEDILNILDAYADNSYDVGSMIMNIFSSIESFVCQYPYLSIGLGAILLSSIGGCILIVLNNHDSISSLLNAIRLLFERSQNENDDISEIIQLGAEHAVASSDIARIALDNRENIDLLRQDLVALCDALIDEQNRPQA